MSTRTAIVTGASRGFGRATAIALVKAGVHVIGVARDREQLDAVRDEAHGQRTYTRGLTHHPTEHPGLGWRQGRRFRRVLVHSDDDDRPGNNVRTYRIVREYP